MSSKSIGVGCLASVFLQAAWAAECPNRQPGSHLDYLGRSADGSVSLWLSAPGSAGSFRLSSPGVSSIDTWSASRPALRLSVSPVVLNDNNGVHKLDALKADGSFDCFLDTRGQSNPVFPNIPPIGGGGGSNGGTGGGVGGGGGGNGGTGGGVGGGGGSNGGTGGGVGGGDGSNGGTGGGVGGGDPIRDIVTTISAGALTTYQTGALSISDRVVVGLDWLDRYPPFNDAWQTWADLRHTGFSNDRNGIDATGHANSVLVGLHRAFGNGLVAGIAAAASKLRLGAFDGTVRNDGDGVFVGPYAGYRLSPNWLLDGWAGWGRTDNDSQLAALKGNFRTTTGFASANLTGGHTYGHYLFRPKLALFYSRSSSDAFEYTGTLPYAGQVYDITLRVNDHSFDYATSEVSGDVSRVFTAADGTRITPALRVGVRYDIKRPNDGKTLDGALDLFNTSPWVGSVRMALAVEPQRNLRFELVTGYYSVGRQDVDLWDVRLNAAVSF